MAAVHGRRPWPLQRPLLTQRTPTRRCARPERPRPLTLQLEPSGSDTVLHVSGELDVSTAPQLGAQLDELVRQEGGGELTIDLRELRFVDSTGLHVLLNASRPAWFLLTLSIPPVTVPHRPGPFNRRCGAPRQSAGGRRDG